jgi:hypothetical protein
MSFYELQEDQTMTIYQHINDAETSFVGPKWSTVAIEYGAQPQAFNPGCRQLWGRQCAMGTEDSGIILID